MTSWTAESDRQLLLAILAGSGVATPKWENVNLPGRTKESMRQRFMKLKKLASDEGITADGNNAADDDNEQAAAATVSKGANPTPAKKGRGRPPKRKAEDDDDKGAERPKPAKRGRKAKATPQKEGDDEDGADAVEFAVPKQLTTGTTTAVNANAQEDALTESQIEAMVGAGVDTGAAVETSAELEGIKDGEYVDSSWLRSYFKYPSSEPLPEE